MSIHDSPVNTSPSKQKYSFPKQNRFKEKYQSNCSQAFYVLPSIRSPQAPSFGYGQKYDITKSISTKTPAPNAYSLKREFEGQKFGPNSGISIGIGRENLYVSNKINTPGPGAYPIKGTLTQKSLSFGLKGLDISIAKNPGPGAYSIPPSINEQGKYIVSKYKNPLVSSFSPPSSNRFDTKLRNRAPGPGHYNPKTEFSNLGNYFIANFKSHNACSFPTGARSDLTNKSSGNNPGPGSYKTPSDFGPLIDYKNAKKEEWKKKL